MIIHRSLSDNKSPQISRTLLNILTDINHSVVWMASILPLISCSNCLLSKPLGTVPSAPITIGIMFHRLLVLCQDRSTSLISFIFYRRSTERQNPLDDKFFLIGTSSGILLCLRELCASHSAVRILGCVNTTCSYSQISISCTIPNGPSSPSSRIKSYTLFCTNLLHSLII